MKYIFADTNIYIYCALITKGNYTSQTIDNLYKVINREDVRLIVPEIVKLEFNNKAQNILENDVTNSINKVKKEIQNISFPEYLGEQKDLIEKNIDSLIKKRKDNFERVSKKMLLEILENKHTILLQLDNEIFINSYKRALQGKKPHKGHYCKSCNSLEQPINADCIIVESIIKYFKDKKNDNDEIIFCSNNIKDFAIFDEEINKHVLHDDIKKDLNINTKYYTNLPELLKTEFKSNIDESEAEKLTSINLDAKVVNIMYKLGILMHMRGYNYLREAIILVINDFELINQRGNLYAKIADKFSTDRFIISRAIMHALIASWRRETDNDLREQIFGKSSDMPTPTEFIAMVSDYIKKDGKMQDSVL